MEKYRGFTLIELLVVIAIIGILSGVVLASLSSARTKAQDAAIKANLSTIKTQAELWYSNNSNSYGSALGSGSCAPTNVTGMFRTTAPLGDTTILRAITAMGGMLGGTGTTLMKCGISGSSYFIAIQLLSDTTKGWCVDSNGSAGQVTWTTFTTTGGTTGSYTCQ